MTNFSALTAMIFVSFISLSQAHVRVDNPKGGDHLAPLSEINIEWTETQDHGENNWDLYFSLDGGIVWQEIATDIEESLSAYSWRVPVAETALARIKIIQDNSEGSDYEDISNNFTISSSPPDDTIKVITGLKELSPLSNPDMHLTNYPNPFYSQTTIQFSIAKKSHVQLLVYNVLGKKVFSGADGVYDKGTYKIIMKKQDLPNGIYLSVLLANDQKISNKMILGL
jgi:hypothetical protein